MSPLPTLFASLLLVMSGVYFAVKGAGFPRAVDNTLGPAFFPVALGALLVVLVLIMAWQELAPPTNNSKATAGVKWDDGLHVATMCLIIAIYVATLPWIGFLIATPVTLFVMMLFLDRSSVFPKIVVACAVTVLLYAVFQSLLHTPLP